MISFVILSTIVHLNFNKYPKNGLIVQLIFPYIGAKPHMILLLASALLLLPNTGPCDRCKMGKDTLTGRTIYLTYNVEPECEGGKAALLRSINKNVFYTDSISIDNFDSNLRSALS